MDGLEDAEHRLVHAVLAGERLDLGAAKHRTIRAEMVRQLLIGHFHLPDDARPDPRGIRIRNAELDGQLDLTDVEAALALFLVDCRTTEPVLLTRAHLSVADLSGLHARRSSPTGFRSTIT
jgi:hypothetical protein